VVYVQMGFFAVEVNAEAFIGGKGVVGVAVGASELVEELVAVLLGEEYEIEFAVAGIGAGGKTKVGTDRFGVHNFYENVVAGMINAVNLDAAIEWFFGMNDLFQFFYCPMHFLVGISF